MATNAAALMRDLGLLLLTPQQIVARARQDADFLNTIRNDPDYQRRLFLRQLPNGPAHSMETWDEIPDSAWNPNSLFCAPQATNTPLGALPDFEVERSSPPFFMPNKSAFVLSCHYVKVRQNCEWNLRAIREQKGGDWRMLYVERICIDDWFAYRQGTVHTIDPLKLQTFVSDQPAEVIMVAVDRWNVPGVGQKIEKQFAKLKPDSKFEEAMDWVEQWAMGDVKGDRVLHGIERISF